MALSLADCAFVPWSGLWVEGRMATTALASIEWDQYLVQVIGRMGAKQHRCQIFPICAGPMHIKDAVLQKRRRIQQRSATP